jgi:MFS family permease
MIELSLEPLTQGDRGLPIWKNPAAWMREKQLSRRYWIFFSAAFFFDAGFAVYYFLFNLFLLDHGYHEQQIGWVGSASTLGSVVGTLPAGLITRRIGLRPVLLLLFTVAPLLHVLRVFFLWQAAQIGLAFLSGLAMSFWGVCFLPAVARLTSEENRTAAFSFIFSASVGTSMLGGVVCGYLGKALAMAGFTLYPADVKRIILLASCVVVLVGLLPLLRLRLAPQPSSVEVETAAVEAAHEVPKRMTWLYRLALRPFLVRFLCCMALWSALLAAFAPFANIYLARDLHISMERIGLLFSIVQLIQFGMGLLTPLVFRALGLIKGIAATQVASGLLLFALAMASKPGIAISLYLVFSAAQWMSSPGLYNLLMTRTPDGERSSAAASTLFVSALVGSGATALAGVLFTRFGYPPVFAGIAVAAMLSAILLFLLMGAEASEPKLST